MQYPKVFLFPLSWVCFPTVCIHFVTFHNFTSSFLDSWKDVETVDTARNSESQGAGDRQKLKRERREPDEERRKYQKHSRPNSCYFNDDDDYEDDDGPCEKHLMVISHGNTGGKFDFSE